MAEFKGKSNVRVYIFNESEAEFLLELYIQRYDMFRQHSRKFSDGGSTKDQARAYNEMTRAMNEKFGKQFSPRQLRLKVKNMKEKIKKKLLKGSNGGVITISEEDLAMMKNTEATFVRICMEELRRNPPEPRQQTLGNPDEDEDSDEEESDREGRMATQQIQPHIPSYFTSSQRTANSHHNGACSGPSVTQDSPAQQPFRSLLFPHRPKKTGRLGLQNRQRPMTSQSTTDQLALNRLKRSVLLLEKEVLEKGLRVDEQKQVALTNFNVAIDEFRRHIAERRLVARGVDLSNMPVDIPPNMETRMS